jgi:predicted RNA-binding protein with PUA-like domain
VSRQYWLFKTEPVTFSFEHLQRAPKKTAAWDGVRNYRARNYLRDDVKVGDQVFVYHSSCDEPAVMGIAEVVRAGYPDHTAFDKTHDHYDAGSRPDAPAWYMVDVRAERALKRPVTLAELRSVSSVADMGLLRKGNRLSIQPVTAKEFDAIVKLSER